MLIGRQRLRVHSKKSYEPSRNMDRTKRREKDMKGRDYLGLFDFSIRRIFLKMRKTRRKKRKKRKSSWIIQKNDSVKSYGLLGLPRLPPCLRPCPHQTKEVDWYQRHWTYDSWSTSTWVSMKSSFEPWKSEDDEHHALLHLKWPSQSHFQMHLTCRMEYRCNEYSTTSLGIDYQINK